MPCKGEISAFLVKEGRFENSLPGCLISVHNSDFEKIISEIVTRLTKNAKGVRLHRNKS